MNPALDQDLSFDEIVFDGKVRCRKIGRCAVGGGINVARVMKHLGADPLAVFPSGGLSGLMLERLMAAEAVRYESFAIADECRSNITANERKSGNQIRFVLPGPRLDEKEWTAGIELMTAASARGYAVASGSLPRGVPLDFYARLADKLRLSSGAKLVLDTSGPPLKYALDAGVHLVKLNLSEFADLIGEGTPDRATCHASAKKLVTDGNAEIVVLTMGPDGAMLISRDVSLYAKAPPIGVRGAIGAGDAFLAVMVLWMAKGQRLDEALRHAVAGGAAAALPPDIAYRLPDPVAQLAPQVHVETL
jgi:6-phosphofructokinase 2